MQSTKDKHTNEIRELMKEYSENHEAEQAKLKEEREKVDKYFDELLSLKATLGAVENAASKDEFAMTRERSNGQSQKTVLTFGGEQDPLSNFYHIKEGIPVRMNGHGIIFYSTEEAYQYKKAISSNKLEAAEKILREKNGPKAFDTGKTIPASEKWKKRAEGRDEKSGKHKAWCLPGVQGNTI